VDARALDSGLVLKIDGKLTLEPAPHRRPGGVELLGGRQEGRSGPRPVGRWAR
jgi:hypothetical protein